MAAATLPRILAALRRFYGAPARATIRDPFRLILWEQVGYLATDAQRKVAFDALRNQVGLEPADIAAAPHATLRAVTRLGGAIAADVRANRLRQSAELVLRKWNGDLGEALRLPYPKARKAMAEFAMIGEPGADKILVFAGTARLLPLDSNGLRVLNRIGLISADKNYSRMYRRAQEVLAPSLPKRQDALIAGHQLLRRHGQELCKTNAPACHLCPVRPSCAYVA
jgi:endonuclease-3